MTPGERQQLRQESSQEATPVVVAMATKHCHMLGNMYQVQFEGFMAPRSHLIVGLRAKRLTIGCLVVSALV